MYSISSILDGLKNPTLAFRELNRLYYNIINSSEFNDAGINFMDEDWDILIILDACRYDMFEKIYPNDGDLNYKISPGSKTSEFLKANFSHRDVSDTVYISGNPQLERHYESIKPNFYKIYNLWNTDMWDKKAGTIHPDNITDFTMEKLDEIKNKRFVIHYLQPHYPFLNTKFQSFGRDVLTNPDEMEEGNFDIWGLIMRGELETSKKDIKKAYYNNLEVALESIQPLLELERFKVVVTSDHGNMLGERSHPIPIREWGHPGGIYTKELVKVPWLEIEGKNRPTISKSEPTNAHNQTDNEVVNNRLKSLGYK